jgi:replication-associated recombination protein RarA
VSEVLWTLDVAASVVAVTRVGSAWAARVVVTGAVNLALNNHAVSAVVAVDKQRQEAGEEEEDAVPGGCC